MVRAAVNYARALDPARLHLRHTHILALTVRSTRRYDAFQPHGSHVLLSLHLLPLPKRERGAAVRANLQAGMIR